jgi:ubiquinone/menaquinone biosynthesis C-methylase UbiE
MSDTHTTNAFISETLAQYTPRAATYDTSNGGWHARLGRDFVTWAPPPKGGAIMDLACGTGLVSIPYAEAVGPGGIVVGVDVTEAMLNEARKKPLPQDGGQLEWVLRDITNLSSMSVVQEVVASRGGFDVISCCSALVLLENPAEAVWSWVPLLKPGSGRLIIDIPTEERNLQYLLNYPLRRALGKAMTYDLDWIQGIHSLENIFKSAGLVIEKSFRTQSYVPERWYGADQALEVFAEKTGKSGLWKGMLEKWKSEGVDGGLEKVEQTWSQLWTDHLNAEGKLWDGQPLYVTIGTRRD